MRRLILIFLLLIPVSSSFGFTKFESPNYHSLDGTFSVTVKDAPKNDVTVRAVVDNKIRPALHITRALNDLIIQVKDPSLINANSVLLEILQYGRVVRRKEYHLSEASAATPDARALPGKPVLFKANSVKELKTNGADTTAEGVLFHLPNSTDYVSMPNTWAVKAVSVVDRSIVVKRLHVTYDGNRYSVVSPAQIDTPANIFIDTGTQFYVYFMRHDAGVISYKDLLSFSQQYNPAGPGNAQIRAGLYAFHKNAFDRSSFKYNELYKIPSDELMSFYSKYEARIINANIEKFGTAPLPRPLPLDSTDLTSTLNCHSFDIKVGFLKSSIESALQKCGYTIGNWRFGDVDSEFDYSIEHPYKIDKAGLLPFLGSIEDTYLLKGFPNRLDFTVDFEPARGSVSPSLNLK